MGYILPFEYAGGKRLLKCVRELSGKKLEKFHSPLSDNKPSWPSVVKKKYTRGMTAKGTVDYS